MAFYVGQKVICVGFPRASFSDRWCEFWHPPKGGDPKKGNVYTVSRIHETSIEIAEINSPADEYWLEGFLKVGFRPVVERKTDISIFTEILNRVKPLEPVL